MPFELPSFTGYSSYRLSKRNVDTIVVAIFYCNLLFQVYNNGNECLYHKKLKKEEDNYVKE